MAIEYVAYNQTGERVAGILQVESPFRAEELLWGSGHIIVRLKRKARRRSLAQLMPTLFGVKALDIITFSRQLSSILQAGIPLVPALRIIHQQVEKPAIKEAIASIRGSIQQGNSFTSACSRQPSVFPSFYIRLTQVAEEAGELKSILRQVADFMDRQRISVAKVKKALTYPTLVLIMGTAAMFIFVTFSLPTMATLLEEYGGKLPTATQIVLNIANASRAYAKYALPAVAALAALGWWYFHTRQGKRKWDRILFRAPIANRLIGLSEMSRLCATLSTLRGAGVPLVETIRLTHEATENSVFREALERVHAEISTGTGLEPAIVKQKIFPPLFSQTIGVGEETGTVGTNLEGLAAFYDEELDRALTRATALIEPMIIAIVGLMVGLLAMAVISGMYSILTQIG